jgi:hypothetical protein
MGDVSRKRSLQTSLSVTNCPLVKQLTGPNDFRSSAIKVSIAEKSGHVSRAPSSPMAKMRREIEAARNPLETAWNHRVSQLVCATISHFCGTCRLAFLWELILIDFGPVTESPN